MSLYKQIIIYELDNSRGFSNSSDTLPNLFFVINQPLSSHKLEVHRLEFFLP